MTKPTYEELEEQVEKLTEALAFYGDPDSYFAVAVRGDSPCGEFAYDLSEIDGTWRPGKRARETLVELLGCPCSNPVEGVECRVHAKKPPKFRAFILNRGFAETSDLGSLCVINEGREFDSIEELLRAFIKDVREWSEAAIRQAKEDEAKYDYLPEGWAAGVEKAWGGTPAEVIERMWDLNWQNDIGEIYETGSWNFGFEALAQHGVGTVDLPVAVIQYALDSIDDLEATPDFTFKVGETFALYRLSAIPFFRKPQ